jgi:hypothetical protein
MNKVIVSSIALYISLAFDVASAGTIENDHLTPDASFVSSQSNYEAKLNIFFREGRDDITALRSWVIPSFSEEQMIVARKVGDNYEVVSIAPSISIRKMEILEEYEAGVVRKFDSKGAAIPLSEDPEYLELKRTTPREIGSVKSIVSKKEIPREIYDRMAVVWSDALLGVKRETSARIILDGTAYGLSAFINGYGVITGGTQSPPPGTKMAALTELIEAALAFSKGKSQIESVSQALDKYSGFVKTP